MDPTLQELQRLGRQNTPGRRDRALTRLRLHQRWYGSPFLAVEPLIPAQGRILDAGCGFGMFSAILALRSPARSVEGVDIDAAKIARARRLFGGIPGLQFRVADLGSPTPASPDSPAEPGAFDAVVIYDVLHHLSLASVQGALAAARRALRPGGRLVIKENDVTPPWKYAVSCLVERVAVGSGLTQSDPVEFRSPEAWAALVAAAGFAVDHAAHLPAREGFFVPHALILARG